jgi:Lipocalin-like domain
MRTSTRGLWAAGFLVVPLGVAQIVGLAQRDSSNSPVIGVWRISETTFTRPNARTVTNPQPSVVIFTRRYYSTDRVTSDAPRPELPAQGATDKQIADVYRPFVGNAGTYEIKGNEITLKRIVSKNPKVMRDGNLEVNTFKMEGKDTLWLTEKADEMDPS